MALCVRETKRVRGGLRIAYGVSVVLYESVLRYFNVRHVNFTIHGKNVCLYIYVEPGYPRR
jgi:hypothetical protein